MSLNISETTHPISESPKDKKGALPFINSAKEFYKEKHTSDGSTSSVIT